MYYDIALDKFRAYENGAWTDMIGGSAVTAASVAEINTGTDDTKFASPLGLEGSKYVEQDNTKLYATTTGTATAYVLTTAPSFTPATGTVISVKFHLANTGAATINVNGSGAVALQKDLSTALVANDIPINSEYTIRRTSTGWLVTDLGFAGINLSARLLVALSDETGTGVAMFGTTPTVTTSILGSATFSAFNTVTTNLSFGGAATTMTIGGTPTTAITHTYSGNATANTITKTINFGTGGASGSTTAINFGSATAGANNTFKFPLLTSGTTNDSLVVADASTGQLKRISSARIGGGGSGWGLTGNTGLSSTANWTGNNDDISFNVKVNNVFSGEIAPSAYGRTHFGYNAGTGAKTALSFYTTLIGSNAGPSITGNGNTGVGEAVYDNGGTLTNSVAIGRKAATTLNAGDNNVAIGYFTGLPSTSGSHQLNIQNVIWGVSCNGIYTSPTTPAGRIGIGTNAPNAGSILELSSTTQGFLPTRMTGTQAAAITPKEEGLMVYVKDATGGFAAKGWYGWNGASWEKLNP